MSNLLKTKILHDITLLTIGLLLALLLSISGCSIEKAPVQSEVEYGSIYITTQDPYNYGMMGASIYLDGNLVPNVQTPGVVQATVGTHTIILEKQAFHPDTFDINIITDSIQVTDIILTPINSSVGKVYVTAIDSTTGNDVGGAEIFYNNVPTGFVTPDTLENILVGSQTFGVVETGYGYRETTVSVAENVVSSVTLLIPSYVFNGIRIQASLEAKICIDERLSNSLTPWIVEGLANGTHSFSCYKEGYLTEPPNLVTLQLPYIGSIEHYFNLTFAPNGVGRDSGQVAPGFTLKNAFGDSVSLGGYQGHVVLLTFWMLSCGPCMEELPSIQDVFEELGPQGFRVLGINPAQSAPEQLIVKDDLSLTIELLVDKNPTVATYLYGQPPTYGFPVNVLIDQRGEVFWYTGSLEYQQLKDKVLALLNQ